MMAVLLSWDGGVESIYCRRGYREVSEVSHIVGPALTKEQPGAVKSLLETYLVTITWCNGHLARLFNGQLPWNHRSALG